MNMVSAIPSDEDEKSGSTLCQEMALTVLDDYTERLINLIETSEEGVTVSDIRGFLTDYKTNNVFADQEPYKVHFQRCVNRYEREVFDPNRRYPFRRALTHRISALFATEGELNEAGPYVSRRILPGLFITLEKMVGVETFDSAHDTCMDLINTLEQGHNELVWEDLYNDPATNEAINDLLVALIPHFANPMRRMTWMMTLINSELAPAQEYLFEGPAVHEWQLDEAGLIRVLRLLFKDLKKQLKDKDSVAQLSQRYGNQQARGLLALMRTLDKAEV
ncbi:hypothetical protein V5T82_09835 [Magnetovibrio sp. PR-2]|uniref:hypothetical protein n=1 Tax=Magnetovibrio sp. PR-2 TaxID=3120356 RepID=UPI002FCE57DE